MKETYVFILCHYTVYRKKENGTEKIHEMLARYSSFFVCFFLSFLTNGWFVLGKMDDYTSRYSLYLTGGVGAEVTEMHPLTLTFSVNIGIGIKEASNKGYVWCARDYQGEKSWCLV